MKINERGPLPDHTRLSYQECYAKILLEDYIAKFKNGLLIQDKPDLFSSELQIGIEVTDVMPKDKKEAVKLWYTMPYVSQEKQVLHKARMEKLGYPYQDGVMVWKSIDCSEGLESEQFQPLYKALNKKLLKLNKGLYDRCKRIECLFFAELFVRQGEHVQLSSKLSEIQNQYNRKFDTIYVVDDSYIYEYDFTTNKGQRYYYNDDNYTIAVRARKMVIEGENNA